MSAAGDHDAFSTLQARLVPLWRSIGRLSDDEQTVVVIPSVSVEIPAGFPSSLLQAYEERYLFLLLLLRQPRARLIYVTSQTIHPGIVDYYLDLLPGVISSHARARLTLVSALDGSARPLTKKILDRPPLIERIRSLIPDPTRAHFVPFATTSMERELALALGIPMYGADPKHLGFGTKSGCRKLFAEEGVPHPAGHEDLRSEDDIVESVRALTANNPSLRQVYAKHDEGIGGMGNAVIDLSSLVTDREDRDAILRCVRDMRFELPGPTYESFISELAKQGGVVEEKVVGEEVRSPSVQMRITPLGEVELLSTHDQVLGGPSGQLYFGCRFPADPAYAPVISEQAMRVGTRLVREGVIGRFAVDFVVVRTESGWDPYAIELNLRKGGTTHPFLTLQFLTDGRYDPETATFVTPSGAPRYFVASDHIESETYKGLTPEDLFDIAVRRGLHYDHSRQSGVVFHMISALSENGRIGMTAVADTAAGADELYARAVRALDEEAQAACGPIGL